MTHLFVTAPEQLDMLLEKMRPSGWVALDTEFISEYRYQSQLCLIQIAYEDGLALIDPLALSADDLATFWSLLCDCQREVILHAGRHELEFCFKAVKKLPEWLFDVQIAAGFVGLDFPAGFGVLTQNLLHLELPKGETRTDWCKRPLSERQIEYALNDVRPLNALAQKLKLHLKSLDRFAWFHEEAIQTGFALQRIWNEPKWKETAKCLTLPPREQAIVRELWFWRDRLAKKTNQTVNRVLRDDLVVEIAKLKSADIERIEAIRGMERSSLIGQYREISAAVQRALNLERSELPQPPEQQTYPQYQIMVQVLHAVLNMICKENHIATSLVASQKDVREFIAHVLGTLPDGIIPRLSRSWRAKLLQGRLEQVLLGKRTFRLNPQRLDDPIDFGE